MSLNANHDLLTRTFGSPPTTDEIYDHLNKFHTFTNVLYSWKVFAKEFPSALPETYYDFIRRYPEIYADAMITEMSSGTHLGDLEKDISLDVMWHRVPNSSTYTEMMETYDTILVDYIDKNLSYYLRSIDIRDAAYKIELLNIIDLKGVEIDMKINPDITLHSDEILFFDGSYYHSINEKRTSEIIHKAHRVMRGRSYIEFKFTDIIDVGDLDLDYILKNFDDKVKEIRINGWYPYFPGYFSIRRGDTEYARYMEDFSDGPIGDKLTLSVVYDLDADILGG